MFLFAKKQRYSNIPYTPLADQSGPRRRSYWSLLFKSFVVVAAIALITVALRPLYNPKLDHLQQPTSIPVISKDFRTVGLVFYGRRSRVEILNCYLKQNLKANGGLLDEVIFLARTDDVDDLAYLDHLVRETKGYSRRNLTDDNGHGSRVTYGQAWEVVERGTMYIKIDDDIMFIEKNAIASLVATKIAHPEHFLISTNTINSPRLAWLHSHLGAIHPYLPELSPPAPEVERDDSIEGRSDWHPSLLPPWDGNPATFSLPKHPSPPRHDQNIRWLPLPAPYDASLKGTPMELVKYEESTEGLTNWAVAAQQHYSFLQNLERDELWRYWGGHGKTLTTYAKATTEAGSIWNMRGTRIQINLICIWGDDIVDNLPVPADDERYLTVDLVERLGRSAVVDLRALAVHFAFRHQRRGVEGTDLLGRYRKVAEEKWGCARSSGWERG
ncbi:MAG: hypothetical protein Q9181_004511 [Wetmoreana brouardii]